MGNLLSAHTSAVTESPVVWRKCHSEHVQITLNKT